MKRPHDQNAILNKDEHGYQMSKTKLITEGYVCIPEPLTSDDTVR